MQAGPSTHPCCFLCGLIFAVLSVSRFWDSHATVISSWVGRPLRTAALFSHSDQFAILFRQGDGDKAAYSVLWRFRTTVMHYLSTTPCTGPLQDWAGGRGAGR